MYGLIVKLTTAPGKRKRMIELLTESAADMPGCLSYVVAEDIQDADTLWVTEVWETAASHQASLSLPAVKNAIPQAKLIVSSLERIAATNPVWGAGLRAADTP
jgi:quinol monooxygenase YgiN